MSSVTKSTLFLNEWYVPIRIAFLMLSATMLGGCEERKTESHEAVAQEVEVHEPDWRAWIPIVGTFDVTVLDREDHQKDLLLVHHGKNTFEILRQETLRQFKPGEPSPVAGFHPGNIIPWDGDPSILIEAAEGDNAIRSIRKVDPGYEGLFNLTLKAPRFIYPLNWPECKNCFVSSPYASDQIDLLMGFDPLQGTIDQHRPLPLAKTRPSIREPDRLVVGDLNGDDIDEILIPLRLTKEILIVRHHKKLSKIKFEVLAENSQWAMPRYAEIIDVDGKNNPDIVLADEVQPGKMHLLLSNPDGKYTEADGPIPGSGQGVVAMAKNEKKGQPGLLAVSSQGSITLYDLEPLWRGENNPLAMTVHYDEQVASHILRLDDLDADGHTDLVAVFPTGLWIVYGPLKDHFKEMELNGFQPDVAIKRLKSKK